MFLQNLRTCFYGNQTCRYFNIAPIGIEDYLELPTHSLFPQDDNDDNDDNNDDDTQVSSFKYIHMYIYITIKL
jgi:hypothetical protein